jgi:hypothetical protein
MNSAASFASSFGTSQDRTVKLRQKLTYLRGHHRSKRAVQFERRLETAQPIVKDADFNSIATLPDWILLRDEDQVLIGLCAAILNERDAIDRELSGERLIAIAAVVGGELFEKLCEVTLTDNLQTFVDTPMSQLLSRPEDLHTIGHQIRLLAMEKGSHARRLCDIAADLIMIQNERESDLA